MLLICLVIELPYDKESDNAHMFELLLADVSDVLDLSEDDTHHYVIQETSEICDTSVPNQQVMYVCGVGGGGSYALHVMSVRPRKSLALIFIYVKHPYKMVRMSRKLKMLKIWFETKKIVIIPISQAIYNSS